jgi:hypothetical protein
LSRRPIIPDFRPANNPINRKIAEDFSAEGKRLTLTPQGICEAFAIACPSRLPVSSMT